MTTRRLPRLRDTLDGRTRIFAEHARLIADEILGVVELVLSVAEVGRLDDERPARRLPARSSPPSRGERI